MDTMNFETSSKTPTMQCIKSYVDTDDVKVFSLIKNDPVMIPIYHKYMLHHNIFDEKGMNIFNYILDNYPLDAIRALSNLYGSNIDTKMIIDHFHNKELIKMKLDIIIKKLIDDTIRDSEGNTCFHIWLFQNGVSSSNNSANFVKKIINANPKLINIKNIHEITPFQLIILFKWLKLGYYCIKRGANIFISTGEGIKTIFSILNNSNQNTLHDAYYLKKIQNFAITQYTENYTKQLCCFRSLTKDNLFHEDYLPKDMFNLIVNAVKNEKIMIIMHFIEKYECRSFKKMKIIKTVFRNHEGFNKLPADAVDKLMMHILGWKY